jgi:outer membrane protein assembly factor BamB
MTGAENQRYCVCSTCRRTTPAGKQYCQYCWTRLSAYSTISAAEAVEVEKRWARREKLKKLWRRVGIPAVSLIIVGSITLTMLYKYTDIFDPLVTSVTSNSAAGQWSMIRGDLARTGAAGSNATLPQGQILWTFKAGAPIQGSPAVVGGTVYIGSEDHHLYALDAATGSQKWAFEAGSFVDSSPVVANGIVYVGSNDGFFYAIDANTGKKLWSFKTFFAVLSSAAVADGIVYFGADDYYIYALDAKTGHKIWSFRTGSQVRGSPVVSNGIVYVGSDDANLYALGAKDGKFRLHFKAGLEAFSPAVVDSTVYFSSFDGYLFAIDGKARNWPFEYDIKPIWLQMWAMHIAPKPPGLSGLLWGMWLGSVVNSAPAVSHNTLYVGVDNNLDAVDLSSRAVLWSFKTGDDVFSSPAAAGDTVYIGSNDGKIYAVDTATGSERWHLQTGDKITGSPTLVDGTLYVGSCDGKLYAIR